MYPWALKAGNRERHSTDNLRHFEYVCGNMPEGIWLVTLKGLVRIGVDLPCDIWLCG